METIHHEFVRTSQAMTSRYHIFRTISDWISHIKKSLDLDITDNGIGGCDDRLHAVLTKEVETWELIVKLYYYRLIKADTEEDMESSELINEKTNEIATVRKIIENDQQLKEVSLTLEWLESIYASKTTEPVCTARDINWENTLAALKRNTLLGKVSSEYMVTEIDPDACVRENKKLHQLDLDEEANVQKGAFYYIRCGEPEKAISFLKESGHVAKSAMLLGYEFTETVNFEESMNESVQEENTMDQGIQESPYRILGNKDRDIWKRIAFMICESNKNVPDAERAAIGALCGHRKSMVDAGTNWEDKLWAFLKTLLDVEIEEHLRSGSVDYDSYVPLPDQYWLQKLTLAESISKILDGMTDNNISTDTIFTIVQQFIILDDVGGFLKMLQQNIPNILGTNEDSAVVGHTTRFLTHLILFFGVVELDKNFKKEEEMMMNVCSEAYIKVLVNAGQFCYIPFYVNKLSEDRQILAIVSHITPSLKLDMNDINCFLEAAVLNDLNILQIAIAAVEKLRTIEDDFNVQHLHWIAATYHYGEEKQQSMVAFLRFTLLISRKYLVLGNLRKVRQLMAEVNDLCTIEVINYSESYKDTYIRELLCYKAYLDAEDALTAWRKAVSQKPFDEKEGSRNVASLSDRARKESKKLNYEDATMKWKKAVDHFLNIAIDKFMQLLNFPQGWLLDCATTNEEDAENVNETTISVVRRIVLPKIVFIVLKLVQEKKSQEVMRQFLYAFCEDSRCIYKEMSNEEISVVFKAIEEFTRTSPESISSQGLKSSTGA